MATEPSSSRFDFPAAAAAETAVAKPASAAVRSATEKPTMPRKPAFRPPPVHSDTEQERPAGANVFLLRTVPSWLVSMIVHTAALIVLALLTTADDVAPAFVLEAANVAQDELNPLRIEQTESIDPQVNVSSTEPVLVGVENQLQDAAEVDVADDVEQAAAKIDLSTFGRRTASNDLLLKVAATAGSALKGRGTDVRGEMLAEYGGTPQSEAAVAKALEWLAAHQLSDGGWNFNHHLAPSCGDKCDHPGSLVATRNGATAMALLPFLGAGLTHMEGEYSEQIAAGLDFLKHNGVRKSGRLSFAEVGGYMYSHGMCAIVLCEAYAMSQDRELKSPAQDALDYIVYAQHVGGGWRYGPREPGDTSVVGWQMMALKSGHMADLRVPPVTIRRTTRFLNSVQSNNGAGYGYKRPGNPPATTAVGLLSRMYLGWEHDRPALQQGVMFIDALGVSKTDMYYNYYATQVMRHYEGEMWERWNGTIRDWLVETQSKSGHTAGSWYIEDDGRSSRQAGRLYNTSLAAMILEIYYRHMPIYRQRATEDDFPL